MTAPNVITPQLGDKVHLKTITAQLNIFGVISDLDTPDQVSATLELFGGNGVLSLAALMGPPGPAGTNAPIPKLQPDVIDDPDNLPTNLTDDDVDVGKYWIIEDKDAEGNVLGSKAYLWHGNHWQVFMMGSPGPAGPVPIITPNVVLLDPDGPVASYITVTGNDFNPTWTLYLKAPRGPQGPSTTIATAPDFDGSIVPEIGDAIVWNGVKWAPTAAGTIVPKFYTMPESSFTSGAGIGTTLPIGAFPIPAPEWDWIPVVWGHMRAVGVELDADPLIIGCEVRLGDPSTGQLVGRGWGNISTWTTIVPHYSTHSATGDAAAPGNGKGVVPAGHTGNEGTLYVRLFNDGGFGGAYNFNRSGAQLGILLLPAFCLAL
jgi:hypothetical protein